MTSRDFSVDRGDKVSLKHPAWWLSVATSLLVKTGTLSRFLFFTKHLAKDVQIGHLASISGGKHGLQGFDLICLVPGLGEALVVDGLKNQCCSELLCS